MPRYRVVARFTDRETGDQHEPGETIDVDKKRGGHMLAAHVVEAVDDQPEAAVGQPSETATKPRAKSRSKKRKRSDSD